MTSLALDLGQTVGWVRGGTTGPIECGSFTMPTSTDLGKWLAGSDAHLPKLMQGVKTIAMEQPFLGSDYYPARKLLALLGHVYMHAHYMGISSSYIEEVPVSTGKLTLTGYGLADKDRMIAAACDWYGWEPHEINEHIADAGGILKVHLYGPQKSLAKKARSGKGRSVLKAST